MDAGFGRDNAKDGCGANPPRRTNHQNVSPYLIPQTA